MPTLLGPLVNENFFLVLFISGSFRLTVAQPVKDHEPRQEMSDVNFVQNVAASRSIVAPEYNQ